MSLSSSGFAVPKKHFRGHFDLKICVESSGSDYPLARRRIPAQAGQCTVTIVAVEKPLSTHSVCVCVCVCVCARVTCYPACRAHAPYYCHLWFVWQYHYFSYRLLNGTIYRKNLLNIKCVFIFSPQVLFEMFLILRRIQRAITINVHRYSYTVPVIVVRFNQLEFSRLIFGKSSDIKFHENPSSGSRVCGQKNGQAGLSNL